MRILVVLTIAVAPSVSYGQTFIEKAKGYQQKYKDDDAIILQSNITYDFSKGTRAPVKLVVTKQEKILSLRYNSAIIENEWYDANSKIESFYATSSLKQKVTDENKVCGSYTSEGLFYDDSKFCMHQLRLKEVGEVWDLTSVKKIDDAKYLTTTYFQGKFPLETKKITFVIPEEIDIEIKEYNLVDFKITKSERKENGNRIVEYVAKDLPAQRNEEYDRGSQYTLPHVLVLLKSISSGSAKVNILSSPQDLYSWYYSLTKQLKPNALAYKSTVTDLIKDKTTDEDKIKAIYYWVQDNIRYIAFEDGVAAFKPSEAQEVFEKRYGDCKGMANLTKEMLKTAGYDARLTWIGTRRIMYDHSIPSLAVNNHMICTVILNQKKYYLDATEKYIPFGKNAARIQNRSVMIEDGSKFMLDNVTPSEKGADSDSRNIIASIKGETIEGKVSIDLTGEAKKNFLYAYHYTKSERRDEFVSNFVSNGNSSVKTSEVKLPDLEERSGGLSLGCNMTFNGAVSSFNNEYYIDIDPSKSFKDWIIKDTRQNDIDYGEKVNKRTSIELAIPAGYVVSSLPEKVEITDPEFSFLLQYDQKGDKILYTKQVSITDGIIKKKSFQRWNDAVKKLAKGYENQIILKK